MKSKIIALALLTVTFIACNTAKKEKAPLKGGVWEMTALNGQTIDSTLAPKAISFQLSETDNKVSGFSGCNRFMGTYTVANDSLSFSQMASTRMACMNAKINENEVLKSFAETVTYKITGNQLALINAEGKTVSTFKKAAKTAEETAVPAEKTEETTAKADNSSEGITEKYWKLITISGDSVQMAENQAKEQHFILKTKDKRIQGFGGCNTFNGEYILDTTNHSITFAKMASTLKACPDVKINETAFMTVFANTAGYTLEGKTLTLTDLDGKALATFEVVYF